MRGLIIAGVSGDLAKRKLLPALERLQSRGEMPFGKVIGTSRRDISIDGVDVRKMDIGEPGDCKALAQEVGTAPHVFYLSVPPGTAARIASALVSAGFGESSLVLEKPFGFDAASAAAEAREIADHFSDEKVFRVDHYLCKELAHDVAGEGRGAHEIKIFASESVDVAGRGDFYERTGALRDFGNHLLSLAALTLGGASAGERLQALQTFEVAGASRAQYDGYHGEAETFFTLKLKSGTTNILLASGKALAKKTTEVHVDGKIFADGPDRAYEEILRAAARGDQNKFLTMPEIAESWRIMDAPRAVWGEMNIYPQGAELENIL